MCGQRRICWRTLRQAVIACSDLRYKPCDTVASDRSDCTLWLFHLGRDGLVPQTRKRAETRACWIYGWGTRADVLPTREIWNSLCVVSVPTVVQTHSSQTIPRVVSQVCKETVKDVISREGNLAILSLAVGHENKTEIPSWVVDYRTTAAPTSATSIWTLSQKIPRLAYGGHINAAGDAAMRISFTNHLECLQVRGCHVDQICGIGVMIRSSALTGNITSLELTPQETI